MSRNVKHKQNPHVGQKGAKKAAPTNQNASSSDNDYGGVDDISDTSDESEPDVENAETSAIIESGISDSESQVNYHQFSLDDLGGMDFYDENQFFPDAVAHMPEIVSEDTDPVEKPRTKGRVRFRSPAQSTTTSATFPDGSSDGGFPNAGDSNIFWDCDSLAPEFLSVIHDEEVPSSDASSYWDLEPDLGGPQNLVQVDDDSDGRSVGSSSGGSSGYETENDEGETTEEEELDESRLGSRNSVLRQEAPDLEEDRPIPRNKGPRYGSFRHDADKPYSMLGPSGKTLMMFGPKRTRSYTDPFFSPMFDAPAMTGAVDAMAFDLSNSFGNTGTYGYPAFNLDSSSYDEGESEDRFDDADLDLSAFISFGNETSDEGEPEIGGEEGGASTFAAETPSRTTAVNEERGYQNRGNNHALSHLADGKLVGAFRKNQTQHQLISRNLVTADGLEFGGQPGQGPIRGLKRDRMVAAHIPFTPARKQKNPRSIIASSPGSPLARATAQKRKSSGELPHSHKRNRSTT